MADNLVQEEELEALSAIYPDAITSCWNGEVKEVRIKIDIDLVQDREVIVMMMKMMSSNKIEDDPYPYGGAEEMSTTNASTTTNLLKDRSQNFTSMPQASELSMVEKGTQGDAIVRDVETQNSNLSSHSKRHRPRRRARKGKNLDLPFQPHPHSAPICKGEERGIPVIKKPQLSTIEPSSKTLAPITVSGTNFPVNPPNPSEAISNGSPIVSLIPASPVQDNKPNAGMSIQDTSSQIHQQEKHLKLRYLPHLDLMIELGPHYPVTQPPRKISVKDPTGWLPLPSLELLQLKLSQVWNGEECLWLMVEMLIGEQLINTLEWTFPLVLSSLESTPSTSSMSSTSQDPFSSLLIEHDRLAKSTAFKLENFECEICLEGKKGHRCVRLRSCGDVFCLPCLISYFTLLISEGLVRSVHCPSLTCVKARGTYAKVNPASRSTPANMDDEGWPGRVGKEELLGIVGEELTKRWEWLKEKTRLESDPTVSFCPREVCQAAVPKSEEDEKLRVCEACGYAFCVFCRRGWHGTRNPCAISQSSAIVEKFINGTPEERLELELRYGSANIKRLVAVMEEERANREWVEANSTKCPGCDIYVEKSQGCSHMQCSRCSAHFCFRCGTSLSPLDPYKHYSTPGSSCYNKLFDFIPGQAPGPEVWLADII